MTPCIENINSVLVQNLSDIIWHNIGFFAYFEQKANGYYEK